MTQEEVDRLERDMDIASNNLKRIIGGKGGEGVEKLYGQAYQQLVKVGLRRQLRRKYRG